MSDQTRTFLQWMLVGAVVGLLICAAIFYWV
jgi:hypothetical protein